MSRRPKHVLFYIALERNIFYHPTAMTPLSLGALQALYPNAIPAILHANSHKTYFTQLVTDMLAVF
jgi:hypothetical protein